MKAGNNPFRVQRLDALRFRPQGMTWADIETTLERNRFRGAIVGPHGSGKTTMLDDLAERFEAGGFPVDRHFINSDSTRHGTIAGGNPHTIVLFDGADLLSPWKWLAVKRAPRLIITSHREGLLPTLIKTETNPALLHQLIVDLVGEQHGIDVEDLYERHNGNLRGALLELYDRSATRDA